MFESIPQTIEYSKRPYWLFARTNGKGRASASCRSILSSIYKGQSYKGQCVSTYGEFAANVNVGYATVARSLKRLSVDGMIEKTSNSHYVVKGEEKSRGYVLTPDFFYTSKVEFKDGTTRFLTKTEIDVLSFVLSYTIPQKDKDAEIDSDGDGFVGSVGNIGRLLCISTTTVQSCIYNLMKAELIFRNNTSKTVNGAKISRYVANTTLVISLRRQMRKNKGDVDFTPKQVKDLNAESDRQRYYAGNREKAINGAEKKNHKLRNNPEYFPIRQKYDKNKLNQAKAEMNGDTEEIQKIETEQITYSKVLKAIAQRMYPNERISEDGTVLPSYTCQACEDTGYKIDNGKRCDCYRQTK